MKFYAFAFCIIASLCVNAQHKFENPDLSIEERVEDLISKLTIEEKFAQLRYDAPAIERLNIPQYNWWNECLHGVGRNGNATIFPQAIGMAATWNTKLIQQVADAISTEARAKFNINSEAGNRERYQGLTFWSPNVNLFRDARWGRGQETYGEDPYLTSQIGIAFVNGLQGDHPQYLKVAAMAKHYAVHSGPEKLRHEFDAVVSDFDLWNTYLPAFKALVVDANVEGIMGAYNRTNGVACCAHPFLMDEVLKKHWQFDGYFVSDCWALQDFHKGHFITKTEEESAALALKAGCNLNCGSAYQKLEEAFEQKLFSEKDADENLRELLPTRFRLGLFDPPGKVPFSSIEEEAIRSKEHIQLSYQTALESMVLLKNENNTLPINPNAKGIFVTGPLAADIQVLLGNYYGAGSELYTYLEGISAKTSNQTALRYVQGNLLDRPNVNPTDWFSGEAGEAEITIACMGVSQKLEGEEGEAIASPTFGDRAYIELPPHQIDYIKLLREKAGERKLVVVISGGSAIPIPEIYKLADAVIYTWYPGEQGGLALADILFGNANPSAKLPVTVPHRTADLPPFEDYNMEGRTYRYLKTDPLFPFGFGLSYATYQYSNLQLEDLKNSIRGTFKITNTSNQNGMETFQIYTKATDNIDRANYTLKNFDKVEVLANETIEVNFEIEKKDLPILDDNGLPVKLKGEYLFYVGGSSPHQRVVDLGGAEWLSEKMRF